MGYKPLDFINGSPAPNHFFENCKKDSMEAGVVTTDFTEEEFLDYFLGINFLKAEPPKKFKKLQEDVLENPRILMSILGKNTDYNALLSEGSSIATEWKDIYTNGIVLDKWCKNKQVYKPDEDFAKVLMNTDKLSFSKETIEHLPVNIFYLDLDDCPFFYPIIGAWVHIYSKGDFVQFQTLTLKDHKNDADMLVYSIYDEAQYNDNNYIYLDLAKLPEERFEIHSPLNSFSARNEEILKNNNTSLVIMESEIKRKEVVLLALQLINYITSEKPDIEENPITKNTYRPSATIKNKFSEVQKWDVGIRYGQSIRLYKEKIEKQVKEKEQGGSQSLRKSPIPHFRRAHWQHYWTGKRDDETQRKRILKWVPPSFIGTGDISTTIHKLKI